jgi:two-component system CheB/CheR fusion protein
LFRALEENVLPHLFDLKPGSQGRLRVWSIGCSTGEEAYSLAMLLAEEAERREAPPELHVFASDLAEDMLKKAREGIYPLEAGATISPERLERFFTKEYGRYRVRRALRDIVVFSKHDMFSDPPFSHIDLIVCRNLLCDLQPEVRRAVLSLFYYALEPHGMLVLGSDDPIDAPHQFDCEHEGISLYVKKSGASQGLRIPVPRHKEARRLEGQAPPSLMDAARRVSDIHDRMIADHVPASVLIDAENHVIHYSPRASRYVHVPGGEPTHDFLKIVREPLRSKLRAAIDSVRGDRVPWKSEPFTIATEDGSRRIMVHIELANDARAAGMLLVVFKEVADYRKDQDPTQRMDAGEAISQVQVDLEQTNKRLRGMLASTDPRTPEEEADEHLGTILGELESSKAELQAVNEQLSTLDEENERRLHELAQLSADLQNLLESTGIPTLFLDTELRIVRFTHRAGELFHVRDTDVGRPLADLRHELVYDSLGADALRAVKHSTSVEREVVSATGRSYLARMLPCMVGQGNKGVVINLIDITERKEAEDELRNADRRKDEFIALLAHELRNPLAPISSGIEVLKSGVNDPRLVGQVSATMERQTKQLVRLVDDLLDLSRIRGGKLHLRKSLVTLADIIRDAISAVRPMIEHAQHELTVRLPDEPIMLDADSTRLTQVLANLLNNSARYTAEKGRIQITAERDGGNAIVIVKDNGQGISADALSHVFEMFYQAEDPPIAQSTGLGIGLTLAKTLVELHGGSISVSSEGKDRGSEVTLRLPIATAAARPLATVAEREDDLSGHRVLIVDDNVDAAETLRMLMDTLGDNDVRTASSGSEALKTAMEQRPDIVLLDLKMPEMDGYEVARHIRQEPWGADILLVAVTGWGLEAHKRRTQEAGFDRHLTKPANLAALKAVLGQRRAAQRFSEHRH